MQKDKTEKILEDYNDVFADIYNVLVFGEKYLDEDGLEAGPTGFVYKAESGKLKEQRQIKNKKKMIPTVTIVLNFSEKRWNTSISLHEMLKVPKRLKPFVPDYQINIYDIAFLEDEVIEKFTSDFRLVAKYLKMRRLGKQMFWLMTGRKSSMLRRC